DRDAKPPLRDAEAEPRTFRDRRGDAETRLDEPLSARDRAAPPARECAGRRRLCLAGLMAVLGLANVMIALYAPFATWVWFISVGAIGAKVAAFVLQYAVFRTMIRRARRRAGGAGIGAVARPSSALLGAVAGLIQLASSGDAGAVGFQQAAAPDPEGQPLELDIWYPSDAPAMPRSLRLFQQVVAAGAPISGSQLPLIVILHVTGGGADTHYDTALAVAEAGS